MDVAAGYQFIENWIYFIILSDGQEPLLSLPHDTMSPKLWLFLSLLSVSLGLRKLNFNKKPFLRLPCKAMQIKLIKMIKPLSFWCKLWSQGWDQGVPAASGMVFPGHCGMGRVPAGSQQQFSVQLWTGGIRGAHFGSQVVLVAIVG